MGSNTHRSPVDPTYATIHSVQRLINVNAAPVHSYQGEGNHRHIGAIISPTRYANISPVPFIATASPGRTAQIHAETPPEARSMLERNYTANAKKLQAYNTLQRALKQQIIKIFNSIYLKGLEDGVVAFANMSAREMMVFLFDPYGSITQNDLVDNNNKTGRKI
jgi:hypothetical protein